MGYPHLEDFDKPWCKELLHAANTERIPMDSLRYSGPSGPNENSFLAKTLATSNTLRACMALRSMVSGAKYPEALMLVSVGPDLSSHSSVVAGGVCSTLLDEVMGQAASNVFPRKGKDAFMTLELTVAFKRPVPAPGLLLVKAKIEKVDGNRLWSVGTIEDGAGHVLTTGKAVFKKTKLSTL